MNKYKNKSELKKQNFIDKNAPVPLVPAWILLPLWFVSLALPNLIYSGISFADTLHILKWTVTGVPVAIAVFVAGIRLAIYGPERVKIKFDIFSVIWAVILVYCALQPLWVNIKSPTAFVLEMTCFVTVWAFYVITCSSFPEWGLRPVVVLGNVNVAINIFYAELQIRGMNNLEFLRGTIFEDLIELNSLILPVPGNYIGNTAQQNMFGMWVAMAVLGAVYLFVYEAWKNDPEESGRKVWLPIASLIAAVINLKFYFADDIKICGILAVIFFILAFIAVWRLKGSYFALMSLLFAGWGFWGLMNSTSRSAFLALLAGLTIILIISALRFNRHYVIRFLAVSALIAAVFWASLYSGERAELIVDKTKDLIENYQNFGLRRGIWATSYGMLQANPKGVGIGQYKWHYLDGQREAFRIFGNAPWLEWQYTHWAHNEFIQFFCEGGFIGGVMFIIMYSFWFFPALVGIKRKKEINSNAAWGFALASIISLAAVFTRPFHRIENMVWITLAFALSNREFYPAMKFKTDFKILKSDIFTRLAGIACVCASIAGCVYISSGIYGNYLLRQALSTQQPNVQLYLLEQAEKHPIVYEDTMRNLAYHYLQLGEQTNDVEMIAKGFNILWEQFNREPRSEDIGKLLSVAQRFQLEAVLRELKSYFKPGDYHLQRVPQVNQNTGETINALLLVGGPGSDDD